VVALQKDKKDELLIKSGKLQGLIEMLAKA